jgi:hypothetical protein
MNSSEAIMNSSAIWLEFRWICIWYQQWVVTLLYNIWQYLSKVTTAISVTSNTPFPSFLGNVMQGFFFYIGDWVTWSTVD